MPLQDFRKEKKTISTKKVPTYSPGPEAKKVQARHNATMVRTVNNTTGAKGLGLNNASNSSKMISEATHKQQWNKTTNPDGSSQWRKTTRVGYKDGLGPQNQSEVHKVAEANDKRYTRQTKELNKAHAKDLANRPSQAKVNATRALKGAGRLAGPIGAAIGAYEGAKSIYELGSAVAKDMSDPATRKALGAQIKSDLGISSSKEVKTSQKPSTALKAPETSIKTSSTVDVPSRVNPSNNSAGGARKPESSQLQVYGDDSLGIARDLAKGLREKGFDVYTDPNVRNAYPESKKKKK